eukprot:gnl/TRDRNA2_/TRDRNA2_175192_c0_seq4.p1 gnl/TRDRNA2_/TRDRNA2_175192_c0~~gnl/TRDRNA2_/TRDRNA2_175192_c0_seq4.p1  ORF type:complete len:295 (+),score=38.41 gnl/TRDRNA2_/TRDRNA2_175192_c0_seq4:103-987(+)
MIDKSLALSELLLYQAVAHSCCGRKKVLTLLALLFGMGLAVVLNPVAASCIGSGQHPWLTITMARPLAAVRPTKAWQVPQLTWVHPFAHRAPAYQSDNAAQAAAAAAKSMSAIGGTIIGGSSIVTKFQALSRASSPASSDPSREELFFLRTIAGDWAPAAEDDSAWMTGMKVAEDGTFECKSGQIKDGLVRVISVRERKVNFKRKIPDADDHIFTVDEDFRRMKGYCIQNGFTYTLTRIDADNNTSAGILRRMWNLKALRAVALIIVVGPPLAIAFLNLLNVGILTLASWATSR